jgi:hypothetical protein
VDVLVSGGERPVELEQLTRRLGARRIIRHHAANPGKHEMPADRLDIHGVTIDGMGPFPGPSRVAAGPAGAVVIGGQVDAVQLHRHGCLL